MFTGLVEMTGKISGRSSGALMIAPSKRLEEPVIGESIAVNGCCLTLEKVTPSGELVFHTMAESLRRTNLGSLPVGARVNMERALASGSRLGGHIVQGHVDAAVRVVSLARQADGDLELAIELAPELAPEVVEKGSVAIDGVSLTVVRAADGEFAVRLIPQTLADTVLGERKAGSIVNVETDILGKYVRRQLEIAGLISPAAKNSSSGTVTMDKLREAGFI